MHIINKTLTELTRTEYRACYLANYGEDGFMRDYFVRHRENESARAIMLWDGPEDGVSSLLGWSLLTPVKVEAEGVSATSWMKRQSVYSVQFWVKRPHRRKGYGDILMRNVLNLDPNPHVLPHDRASGELFSKYPCQVAAGDKHWLNQSKRREHHLV